MIETAEADALVLVDAQVGFLTGDIAVPAATDLSVVLTELLDRARRAGALVVHLQNDGPPGAVDEPGRPGWQLYFRPTAGESVLRKTSDDGFAETVLENLLRSHAVNGLSSAACCRRCASAPRHGLPWLAVSP